MKEVGSEFWTENYHGSGMQSLLPSTGTTILTLSGRTALEIIVEDIISSSSVKSIYFPSYCCHTMIEPFVRNGIEITFYDVYSSKDGIHCDYRNNSCDLVFLTDYFGFTDPATKTFAERECGSGKTVIYDRTHSLFNTDIQCTAHYIFGSLRKWIGLNAGFATKFFPWSREVHLQQYDEYCNLRNRAFDLKAQYVHTKNLELKPIFLKLFSEAEKLLEKGYCNYAPDQRSVEVYDTADVIQIRNCRKRNAAVLVDGLKNLNGIDMPYQSIKPTDCPLFVPICFEKRDELKRYLINQNIYCPSHWPVSPMHQLNVRSEKIYNTELSVICDQRYSTDDMKRIVESIHLFTKKTM